MEKSKTTKKDKCPDKQLLELVFSWSIKDVLNNSLFKDKVKKIPDIFVSSTHYLSSFKMPLIEETRADYCSGLESVAQSPVCEISHIWLSKHYKPSKKRFIYDILTKPITDDENYNNRYYYEPQSGDIFAVTNRRPRSIEDLIRFDKSVHIAFVSRTEEDSPVIEILSSENIDRQRLNEKNNERLFVTYLMNVTTNMRIWAALHPDPKSANLGLIQKVLQYNSAVDDDCSLCISNEGLSDLTGSLGLDESQTEAVLSSISLRKCLHQMYNVKLIWGPPGTGKTKTVASLLSLQLKLKCRTLTCAPTNIAVVQVAERLMRLFVKSLVYDTYGMGDIVLFGNEERMKINDHEDLLDIFLKNRVEIIDECLKPTKGWTYSLVSMISLLEDPQALYNSYLVPDNKGNDSDNEVDENSESNDENVCSAKVEAASVDKEEGARSRAKKWKEVIDKSLKASKKENKKSRKGNRTNSQDKYSKEDGEASNDVTKIEEVLTFEEFVRNKFCSLANQLVFCSENLCTHLPTSCLPLDVAKQMIKLVDLLRKVLEYARKNGCQYSELILTKKADILPVLKLLQEQFPKPNITGKIKDFFLENARLIFCTASSSIKVKTRVEMVVIDEAAQLKECESAIPLQIPGLRVAILIGDDRQLPAMVQSKVLEKMKFGRSLFQRIATLGKKKHLLNIQYRMHPSISSFPNKEFYDNKIVDAPNVKEISYAKKFLKEAMFGSYSFINVSNGKENFFKGHSPRNLEEATVIDHIIAKLFKDYYRVTKKKVTVGVISPYKGQVGLLQEKLGKKYIKHKENFCINIRSVDGFQGGEEDIIIISTVRCNGNGSVGFLSNCQRTNVALTRARYCLWIVGSGSTLGNSGSVWKNLVFDAKTLGCFYNADDDIDLNQATLAGKPNFFGQYRLLKSSFNYICMQVKFSDEFRMSITSINNIEVQKRVKKMLHKISDGWRQSISDVKLLMNVAGNDYGAATELLELYKVDEKLNLAWTVNILKEKTSYIQIIKVWDILQTSKIPNLAKNLSVLFGRFTVNFMNRCKYKNNEGNLVVPMSWPLQSSYMVYSTPLMADDPAEYCLTNQLVAMNIGENQEDSSSDIFL
uniref:Uncharacterized protein n=1 Tax=Chenopodium quinoa TaxID=63459 RepID=A0A803LZS6_CHEQI